MKKYINIENKKVGNLISLLFLITIVLFWELGVNYFDVKDYFLPSPSNVFKEFIVSFPLIIDHSKVTIIEIVYGFSISLIIAIVTSLLMDRFYIIKKMLYPILVISQTIPIIAIAPLLMLWFGFDYTPKIIIVVLICFFPITVNLTEGLEAVDKELVELMKSLKANSIQIFLKCKLPSAIPSFFAALRIAATYSVVGAVISEWVGAKKGLGIYMIRAMKSYKTDTVFAIIIFIVILTLIFVGIVDVISKLAMPYKNKSNQ